MSKTIWIMVFLQALMLILAQQDFSEKAWRQAAIYLQQAMNRKTQPCEDFYDFVCGRYGAKNDSDFETTLAGKASAVATVLGDAIRKINPNRNSTPTYHKAIKVFYDKCTAAVLDEQWPKRLYEALKQRIGGLPFFEEFQQMRVDERSQEAFDPWLLMGRVQRELGETGVVEASIDYVDAGCTKKPELQISPTMPAAAEAEVALNLSAVRSQVLSVARVLGLNQTALESKIDPWLQKVSNLFVEWKNLSSVAGEGERIALRNLSEALPGFNWRSYLKGLLPEGLRREYLADLDRNVYVKNKERLESVVKLFERHSSNEIRSFVFLKMFNSIQNEYFGEMEPEELQLVTVKTPHDRCLEYALRHLSPAMARLYFDAIGIDIMEWRHEIQLLGRNIFSAFRLLLNNVDWLDSEDKEKIQKKVDSITFNPGVPSWIKDEDMVMSRIVVYNTSLDPFENEFAAAEKIFDRSALSLVADEDEMEVDLNQEPDPSFGVNAYYDSDSNEITMLLGLMVPPLFNITYPLPVKYGGLGTIIGHELMHAFDADGIYAGVSDDHEWLKEQAFREFAKKKACLVRQYSRYCYEEQGLCVSGERTIGENIADIDGIQVAYTAYKFVTQILGADPPIPSMLRYSSDQIFFMAFARTWCSKAKVTWVDLLDEHTPDRPRVEIALRNVRLFGRTFGCKVGSRYAPIRKACSLWGELEEPARRRYRK